MKPEHFNYKAKKVTIDGYRFDSTLEASLYKILRRYRNVLEIKVHSKIYTGWKVDFDLYPICSEGVNVLGRLYNFTGQKYPTRILIEVKGVIDKNFIKRYGEILGSNIEQILVLVSDECNAIAYPTVDNIVCKPVVPLKMIRDILS